MTTRFKDFLVYVGYVPDGNDFWSDNVDREIAYNLAHYATEEDFKKAMRDEASKDNSTPRIMLSQVFGSIRDHSLSLDMFKIYQYWQTPACVETDVEAGKYVVFENTDGSVYGASMATGFSEQGVHFWQTGHWIAYSYSKSHYNHVLNSILTAMDERYGSLLFAALSLFLHELDKTNFSKKAVNALLGILPSTPNYDKRTDEFVAGFVSLHPTRESAAQFIFRILTSKDRYNLTNTQDGGKKALEIIKGIQPYKSKAAERFLELLGSDEDSQEHYSAYCKHVCEETGISSKQLEVELEPFI